MCSNGSLKMHLIVAKDLNNGIGYKGKMPWPFIKTDVTFMETITKFTKDENKKNAAILGRKSWESLSPEERPMCGRYNIVLTSKSADEISPGAHFVCSSLTKALEQLQSLADQIEVVWIFGGTALYEESMKHPDCERVYVTEILQEFPCDAFCPPINTTVYKLIDHSDDPLVPKGEFVENGVKYIFTVYQRQH